MFTEDDLLPLSALQHLLFCERQCALIHLEQVWVENPLTLEGKHLHERVDSGQGESRGGLHVSRGLPLRSFRLQIRPSGFTRNESGGVVMDDDTRKAVLMAYQKRKQEEILHPFLAEKTTVGLLPYLQAALLARTLRGDLDGYPPFLWK